MNQIQNSLMPFSFVYINLSLGELSIGQVSSDSHHIILSTYHTLSPITFTPELLKIRHALGIESIGTLKQIEEKHPQAYSSLIAYIKKSDDENLNQRRYRSNDLLLLVRAMMHIISQYGLKNITEDECIEALKQAVNSDDKILEQQKALCDVHNSLKQS